MQVTSFVPSYNKMICPTHGVLNQYDTDHTDHTDLIGRRVERPFLSVDWWKEKLPISPETVSYQYEKLAFDGRSHAREVEMLAQHLEFLIDEEIAKFTMYIPEKPGTDGFLNISGKNYSTSVRTLTNSSPIKYQNSRHIGGGRSCDQDNLCRSLQECAFTLVCDICSGTEWIYWLINNNLLLHEMKNWRLSPTGWNRKRFYAFLKENGYDVYVANCHAGNGVRQQLLRNRR